MVRSAVQVCVRTRPTSNFAHKNLNIDVEKKTIAVHQGKDTSQAINNQQEDWRFRLNEVLHNASQEAVFDSVQDVVDSFAQGFNGTIMAYGQTGAGKTFTMVGGSQSYKYRGIIPRTISHVFRLMENRPDHDFKLRISYLEVYNECFYDLLQDNGGSISDFAVMEDDAGQVVIKGLSTPTATTEEEALNLLFRGETNRAIADHRMNANSSRSHCVFTLHLTSRSRVESTEKLVVSKLNLVDLAGSERVKKTGSSGLTLSEAKYINKSLSFLEQVVIALSSKNRDHVPFRQSKLTNVLRDSLGGNCKTRLIANIWAEQAQLEETVSTLKFATRMMNVSNEAVRNIKLDPAQLLRKYERELRELKQELAMHDTLANRAQVQYDEYTPEQKHELQKVIHEYVNGSREEIEIESLRQVRELLHQFRIYTRKVQSSPPQQPGAAASSSAKKPDVAVAKDADDEKKVEEKTQSADAAGMGDIDEDASGGFALGVAPSDASPPVQVLPGSASPVRASRPATAASPRASASPSMPHQTSKPRADAPLQQSELAGFEEFKSGLGKPLEEAYQDNKAAYRSKKAELKKVSIEINESKRQIDECSAALQSRRQQPSGSAKDANGQVVIDEEEYKLIQQLKQHKAAYQAAFASRKSLQNELAYTKGLVEKSKRELAQSFLRWFRGGGGGDVPTVGSVHTDESPTPAGGDELDDAEQFEELQKERIMQEDPNSLSFYAAQKAVKKDRKHHQVVGRTRKGKGAAARRAFK